MKKKVFVLCLLLTFLLEMIMVVIFAFTVPASQQDTVMANEVVQSVTLDWNHLETHTPVSGLDYAVLDTNGLLLYQTKEGISTSINAAIQHRDTILDICPQGDPVGKVILFNTASEKIQAQKQFTLLALGILLVIQGGLCAGYMVYLNHHILKPFTKLQSFAQRIAGGNLDIPLEMDHQNIFGPFTESFDLMRSELKRSRQAEAAANASKKELIAKLSHDIKTPVASIKAAAEVGQAFTDSEKDRKSYTQIIQKADQINALVSNLFSATMKELQQLTVAPKDITSRQIQALLENSDYLHRAQISSIPECLAVADPLRLQQVFDNLFINSYKYAGTDITVSAFIEASDLVITIEDAGGGVPANELPWLTDKFKRGSNASNQEGAGLGLYISTYFMKEMHGSLRLANGDLGLRVTVQIPLSGKI